MAKIINEYAGITATQIKNKASNIGNMSVVGSSVYVTDIKLTDIKNAIGGINTNLGSLCESPNVNIYSNFGPVSWYWGGSGAAYQRKTPYSMGDWAGYNHNALPPRITSGTNSGNVYQGAGTITITAVVNLGEINWKLFIYNCGSIRADLYVSNTWYDKKTVEFTSTYLADSFTFNFNVDTSFWQEGDHSIRIEFSFAKDASHNNDIICDIPNLSDKNITLTLQPYAKLRTWLASSGLAATLSKPSAVLVMTTNNTNNSYVTQSNNTVTVSCSGVDTNSDGIGDLNIFTANRTLYYRVNYGSWAYLGDIVLHVDNSVTQEYTIPVSITYGDLIDVELR